MSHEQPSRCSSASTTIALIVLSSTTSTWKCVSSFGSAISCGGSGMAPLCATLSQRLGVPVIDGVAVAVKFAEALVGLGLRTSKHGDYAPPLPKPFVGWASDLRW